MEARDSRGSSTASNTGILLAGAVMTTYLSFESGGYFPGSTAVGAIGVAVGLILLVGVANRPFGQPRRGAVCAIASLAAFAIWILVSSTWSHAPGRAVIEFDRVLLYLGVLVLFSSLPRRSGSLAALAGGLAVGSVVACSAGLATRTLPAVFPVATEILSPDRLSYPLTYYNALGLLATLGILICLGLSADHRLPRMARVLAAGAVPLLATTLLLTFSRGAIAAGLIGLAVLCAACRTRGLLLTLLASVPPAALAVKTAYSATALASLDPQSPTAVSQGHLVAVVVGLASVAAVVLRGGFTRWDQPPTRRERFLSTGPRRTGAVLSAVVVVMAGGAAAVAGGLPNQLSRQYHQFVSGNTITGNQTRSRLLNAGNDRHLYIWRVAVSAWESEPLRGHGAGTYQLLWNRDRSQDFDVVNAHSVYLGSLADLGVVGLVLLVICLLSVTLGIGLRTKSSGRAAAAGLLAAAVAWLVHAGVDWDWEMPAVTWWLFACGGLVWGRRREVAPESSAARPLTKLLLMLGIAVVALLPVQLGLSQVHLSRAIAAFKRGDCEGAVGDALASASNIGARAEPYEIVGYCDARSGHSRLAIAMIQNAINRDPQDWEFRYDMALVRGFAGLDPRKAAAQAVALNPRNPYAEALDRALRVKSPTLWRARSATAPLLIP